MVFSRRRSAWYAEEGVAFLTSCTCPLLMHGSLHCIKLMRNASLNKM